MARFRPKNPLRRRKGPVPLEGARIVVGLGNPGPHYAYNRHNAGARTTADLSNLLQIPLATKSKYTIAGQGQTPYGPVVIAQTRTYMNESGLAVQSLLTTHRAKPQELILLVNHLDLELGRIRVRANGGDGGHKGMKSVHATIGSLDFPRVRIGIGRPYIDDRPSRDPDVIADYVLADPEPDEAKILHAAEKRAAQAIVVILRDGVEAAMNQFNA